MKRRFDDNYESPLMYASANGHLETVKCLIANKANPNVFSGNNSCLFIATKNNHPQLVKWLWQNIAFKHDHLLEVLRFAITNNKITIVKDYFIDSTMSIPPHLFFACALYGHYDTVKDSILKKHLNPNMPIINGWTTVFGSVKHIQILHFLMNHYNNKRCNGYSLLLFAVQSDAIFTVNWLLKNKITTVNDYIVEANTKITSKDSRFGIYEFGYTALALAVIIGSKEMVKLLLKFDADIYFPLPHNKCLLDLTSNVNIKQQIFEKMGFRIEFIPLLEQAFYYYTNLLCRQFGINAALIIAGYLISFDSLNQFAIKK